MNFRLFGPRPAPAPAPAAKSPAQKAEEAAELKRRAAAARAVATASYVPDREERGEVWSADAGWQPARRVIRRNEGRFGW